MNSEPSQIEDLHREGYETVPYLSVSYEMSHPDRIAAIAKIFSLPVPAIEGARVLELGCASGGNIIPQAAQLPSSKFVGVDFSERHISEARQDAKELKLQNIEFHCLDFRELGEDIGLFDYIIAHGVYSWVPPEARDALLAYIGKGLSPHGMAYVSYNTYPGWSTRSLTRSLMQFHTEGVEDPAQVLRGSVGVLKFISEAIPDQNSLHAQIMRSELQKISGMKASHLYHDQLERYNDPVYFLDFMRHASSHGLHYLADARFGSMHPSELSAEAVETLRKLANNNIVRMEQYLDFVRNRTFRQTLLVREGCQPERTVKLEVLNELHIATQLVPLSDKFDLTSGQREKFALHRARTNSPAVEVDQPFAKAALKVLCAEWPATITFQDLVKKVQTLVPGTQTEQEVSQNVGALVMRLFTSALAILQTTPMNLVKEASAKPLSLPAARLYAQRRDSVPNAYHQSVTLNDFNRLLLPLLDGTRTVEGLPAELTGSITGKDGSPKTDAEIQVVLAESLRRLGHYGLLLK